VSNFAVGVTIGAVLNGAFHHAVTTAPRQLARIGETVALLNKKNKSVNLLEGAAGKLKVVRTELDGVSSDLEKVRISMRGASGKRLTDFKNRAAELERKQKNLTRQFEIGREKVGKYGRAYLEVSGAADKANKSLGYMGGTLEQVSAHETRLQTAMEKRERAQNRFSAARAGLFAPVAMLAGVGMALKSAAEFKTVLTDIGITADLSRERMAELGRTFGTLSTTTGQTRAQLAEGFNVMVTAGMDADRVEQVIDTVGLTATAAGAEIGEVARTMYANINNLKLDPKDALKSMDMLVAAGKAGSFELKDMAKYFPAMTAGASKLGMTGTKAVATLGAALQVAMDGAADPSQAATNMENFMANLVAPETVKRFEQAGINLEAKFKEWQAKGQDPIEEAMKLIQETTGGDPFRIGELFGNKRVLSFIQPMIAGLEKYRDIRAEVAAAENMVSEDARRRMQEDPAYAFNRMGDALKQLRDAAIAPLLAPMGNLFSSIINMISPVTRWMEANEKTVAVLGKLAVGAISSMAAFAGMRFGAAAVGLAFSKTITTIAAIRHGTLSFVHVLPKLRLGFILASKAALGFGRALMLNPIGIVIGLIAGAAFLIYKYWGPISGFFGKLWEGIKTAAVAAWGVIRDSAGAVWDVYKRAWAGTAAFFGEVWDTVKTAFSGGIAGIGALLLDWSPLGLVYKAISAGLGKLGIELPGSFSELGKMMMGGLVKGIKSMFGAVGDAVRKIAGSTVGWFKNVLGINSPSKVFIGLGAGVGEGAAQGIGRMTRTVGRASAALGTAAALAFAPSMTASLPALGASVAVETSAPAALALPVAPGTSAPAVRADTGAPAPVRPAPAPAAGAAQIHYTLNIHQQPGENADALARRVMQLIKREQRQTRDGALGDWA